MRLVPASDGRSNEEFSVQATATTLFQSSWGGAADQALADMAPPMHRAFHDALRTELRKAGFPPIGGKSGSTEIWQKMFDADPAKRQRAIEILSRVTRDFDIERGTSVGPYLDRELGMVKPGSPPPTK